MKRWLAVVVLTGCASDQRAATQATSRIENPLVRAGYGVEYSVKIDNLIRVRACNNLWHELAQAAINEEHELVEYLEAGLDDADCRHE